jgi:GDP-4-dehydro-6-deoxy-D-mannose reductase
VRIGVGAICGERAYCFSPSAVFVHQHIRNGLALFHCDILDKERVESVVREVRPEAVFHLAARSLPSPSWEEPEATFQVNVLGTLTLLDAVRKAGLDPMVVVAGSSSEYAPTPDQAPIREDRPR